MNQYDDAYIQELISINCAILNDIKYLGTVQSKQIDQNDQIISLLQSLSSTSAHIYGIDNKINNMPSTHENDNFKKLQNIINETHRVNLEHFRGVAIIFGLIILYITGLLFHIDQNFDKYIVTYFEKLNFNPVKNSDL